MKGYVFSASDYNKIWCSLQKQMHVVVLCKTSTNIWCDVLFPLLGRIKNFCEGRDDGRLSRDAFLSSSCKSVAVL
jgi:hypothetical protein